ncbi:MAG TPA: endonuclease/exonuclease/phosphatase family protein [Rubrobacter sp.]|nr:endonuclease/exonuclease/phosphatase family protein [Rubrobacter sp.]
MEAGPLRVMSFNIRGFSRRRDGINRWENRAALNVATIKRYAPDLIGLQELQAESLATYREKLPEYAHILGPGAGNKAPHEFNAIFFDPTRLTVLDSGGFWLSETPERYSSAWRTRVVRSANWTKFSSPSAGLSFLHLNTHLDHVSGFARAKGSELILRKITALQEDGLPAVVTGDFNCPPGSFPYQSFVENGFEDTFLAAGNVDDEDARTFHAFKGLRYLLLRSGDKVRNTHKPRRIDWILLKNGRQRLRTEAHAILRDCDAKSAIYPSDHYPMLATLAPTG